jgi:pyruvate/2-oxoglutarate dehydrogenase complex dihydrolipoamide dehydrogenase (E3) component
MPTRKADGTSRGSASESFDAIVLGAGEAGAVLASRAVRAGLRVAMVYRAPYGSTCVNTGCIPSKFLIHRAHVAHVVRTARRFHVAAGPPEVDLAAIVDEKAALIEAHREEALGAARRAEGLALIEGPARFRSSREVDVDGRTLRADRIFIATGMRPDVPDIDGLSSVSYLTNETLMGRRQLPSHLVVIGGGYVGCELGQAFRRFGSQVTLIQRGPRLCPREEPDVSTLLERAVRAEGLRVIANGVIVRVEAVERGVRVVLSSPDGLESTVVGSDLLVATGRRPNSDQLGLEQAGVDRRADGAIAVDERLRTNIPGIWAIGDVNGRQPFTRVCQEEAKVALADALGGKGVAIDRRSLGHAVFTEPQIGSVGLTEDQARDAGHEVAVGLVTFDQIEKAEIVGETVGLIKYVVERSSRQLLGCHVIGPQGAELVYDAVTVIRRGGTLDELARAVGIFPTLQEGMEGAARGLLRRLSPEVADAPLAAIAA